MLDKDVARGDQRRESIYTGKRNKDEESDILSECVLVMGTVMSRTNTSAPFRWQSLP